MSMTVAQLEAAKARFGELLVEQDKRIERMKAQGDFINYAELDKIIIGVCGGDGIGPAITGQAQRILEFLLEEEVEKGRVEFKVIDGLTIERRAALQKAGVCFAGLSPDGRLVEAMELPAHPFYVGVQYHPEFKSRPNRAHPLFCAFVAAAAAHDKGKAGL